MPWSSKFTARVLVANGNIPNRFDFSKHEMVNMFNDTSATYKTLKDLARLASYIRKHKFREAHFEQIYVEEDGDIELIPRVGGQVIILGKIENMEEKILKPEIALRGRPSQQGLEQIFNNKFKIQKPGSMYKKIKP